MGDHQEISVERGGPTESPAADVSGPGPKRVERAKRPVYNARPAGERPGNLEVFGWCLYGLCSYFVLTVLVPVVFPLIISQISPPWPKDNYAGQPATEVVARNGWSLVCGRRELVLYGRLTNQTITVGGSKYSPLEWTSISWGIGLALAAPALALLSAPLDRGGHRQTLIGLAATVAGAAFCLPAGFFRTVCIFPPYIAVIVAAAAVAAAHHARHLGLMVRAAAPGPLARRRFPLRRAASARLSLWAAAAGSLGAAAAAAFAYHMVRGDGEESFTGLWVVSIFGGLAWLVGSVHFATGSDRSPAGAPEPGLSKCHAFSAPKYPHAAGSLVAVFLSSLSAMSIFAGAVLYLVGELCVSPGTLLCFWLAYFLVPAGSLPALKPVQRLLRGSAVKMKLLGLLAAAAAAGIGFAGRRAEWGRGRAVGFAAVQGWAAGAVRAYGRVLVMDCAPPGKEGAFGGWLEWARAAGSCVGFAAASANPGDAGVAFGLGFWTAVAAALVLIFGNVSDVGGAVAASHVRREEDDDDDDDEEKGSPVNGGVDSTAASGGGVEVKRAEQADETP